jgi:hypothetical protein
MIEVVIFDKKKDGQPHDRAKEVSHGGAVIPVVPGIDGTWNQCRVAQSRPPLKCLSRVRGNSHALFLGVRGAQAPCPTRSYKPWTRGLISVMMR